MKRYYLAGAVLLAMGAAPLQAADEINNIAGLAQAQFADVSEDLAAAISYKGLTPAEPLGITGFDVGIEITDTTLENDASFNVACSGCDLDHLTIPRLHLHKGLPMGFDVGISYASSANADMSITGFELRYANIEGGATMPAVATRFTYTRLNGVDDLSLDTKGIELLVSKGFAMLTPYFGVGYNWVSSDPSAATGLDKEEFGQSKYFIGMNINTGFLNFDFEVDETGGAQTLGAKIGFRF